MKTSKRKFGAAINKVIYLLLVLLFLLSISGTAKAGDINSSDAQVAYINECLSPDELEIRDALSVENNTLFSFQIPRSEYVRFTIFDTRGKELKVLMSEYKPAGNFGIELRSANLTKGTYFYRLDVGRYREIRKLIITK